MDSIPFGASSIWSAVAAFFGCLGSIAAILAWRAVSHERKKLDQARVALTADVAWDGAHCNNEIELSEWLATRDISSNSFIGDLVRACWSAWLGGRAPTLTELHVLVARRERARTTAKFSGGVAGLLLLIGIVGTLSSVHPVLKAFRFTVSPDGELQGVAESTDLVNSLINNLGDAFWPSLVALFFTVLVVMFRGLYSHTLHALTLELDRFAIGTIIPQYRPVSISQEYAEVKKIFSDLSEKITKREDAFGKVVNELKQFGEKISPAIAALKKSAETSEKAATRLGSRSQSIAEGLKQTLGSSSPLFKALKGFEGIFERSNENISEMTVAIETLGRHALEDRADLKKLFEDLRGQVAKVGSDHKSDRDKLSEALSRLEEGFKDIPRLAVEATSAAAQQGLSELNSNAQLVLNSIAKTAEASLDHISRAASDFPSTLDKISAAAEAIPASLEKISGAADAIPTDLNKIGLLLDTIPVALTGVNERVHEGFSTQGIYLGQLKDQSTQLGIAVDSLPEKLAQVSQDAGLDVSTEMAQPSKWYQKLYQKLPGRK